VTTILEQSLGSRLGRDLWLGARGPSKGKHRKKNGPVETKALGG